MVSFINVLSNVINNSIIKCTCNHNIIIDIRRRIELIQDFDMPGVSTSIKVTNDGQYILATGIYKPRVKCFDVKNLSLKFERCFDSEAVTFEILSDDYSKVCIYIILYILYFYN